MNAEQIIAEANDDNEHHLTEADRMACAARIANALRAAGIDLDHKYEKHFSYHVIDGADRPAYEPLFVRRPLDGEG